jgi:predicted SAM-dependent methyltransferase
MEHLRVVIGAGEFNNNPGWLHTNENELNLLKRIDWEGMFKPNTIEAILAEHVWEHLSFEEGVEAGEICFDYLKPGGYIRCAVPDGFFPDKEYQKIVQVGGPGPKDHPAASHKIVHNYKTITNMFSEAGYEVKLLEYCDESGNFHYNEWDEKMGFIYRSLRFDDRNKDEKLGCVSLIIDATKPIKSNSI